MKATGFVVAAIFNLIVYIVVLGVLFFSGSLQRSPVAADVALDQIEKSSRALAEEHRARALQRPNEERVSPVDRPGRKSAEIDMAAKAGNIADALAPIVRGELRAQRRAGSILSIAAPVMAFSPIAVLVVLARFQNASVAPAREPEEQTGSDT